MNVKRCLKVDNGLPYITVSLKLEGARLYTTKGGARRGAAVARRLVARRVLRIRTVGLYLAGCGRCVR
jgi:hypothetical protein